MVAESDTEWDVVIVGSGFAGALIANEFKPTRRSLSSRPAQECPPTLTLT
jgi:hypothetical protein